MDAASILLGGRQLFDIDRLLQRSVRAGGRILAMLLQCGGHGEAQPFQAVARVGSLWVAAAESAVDFPVGVQEKCRPGHVVIELEQAQVSAGDANQAHADELVGEVLDLFQTDNLPVKLVAIPSRIAAEDHHHRLARLLRLHACRLQRGMPTLLRGNLAGRALGVHQPGRRQSETDHAD